MKALAKSLALKLPWRQVAIMLPWSLQEVLFNALCEQRGLRTAKLFELARRTNIVALKVGGEYGVLQGTPRDSVLLSAYADTGQWAPRTTKLFKDFFAQRDGGTYIDIGANIGATTIPVAQNPRVMCLAIEPMPVTYGNLVANVAANCHHGNVETLQVAVFSRRSTLPLELCSENTGDDHLRLDETAGRFDEEEEPTISVAAVPLDEIAPRRGGALGIKIDVQGSEPFIFEGGQKTLARADLIVMEFWPYGMDRMGVNPECMISFLEHHFHAGSLADGETGGIPAPQPIAVIVRELRHLFDCKRCDPARYWDIIISRSESMIAA